jgi:uncharacterized membrane protein
MATRQSAGKSGKRTSSAPARGAAPRSAAARAGAAGTARTGAARNGAAKTGTAKPAAAKSGPVKRAPAEVPPPGGASGPGAGFAGVVRWAGGGLPLSTLIVSILGVADSAYLVYQHFSESTTFAGCPDTGTINCEKVTTSPWSYLLGSHLLPVSVLGLAFFLFMVVINSPWGWRAPWPAVHWVRLAAVIVGVVLVLYLIWAELFRINAICLFCTGVHLLTFILFALIVGKAAFSGVQAVPGRD